MMSCFMPRRKKSTTSPLTAPPARRYSSPVPPSSTLPTNYTYGSPEGTAYSTNQAGGPARHPHPAGLSVTTSLPPPPRSLPSPRDPLSPTYMGDRTTTGAAYPLHRSTSTPIAAVPDSAATVAHWQAMPLPPPPLTRFERNTLSSASTLSFANSFGSSDGTIIPTLSHKHSAWSLADHKAGPEACIPPPKRSWRTSYEVW